MTTTLAVILALLAAPLETAQGGGATLTIAVGKIESKALGAETYAPLAAGSPVPASTWIRTDATSLASLTFGDGTSLRINRNSEVLITSSRKLRVQKGDIHVITPEGNKSEFLIEVSRTRFRSKGPEFAMGHEEDKSTSSFFAIRGSSTVATRRDSQFVTKGYWCQTVGGTLNTPDQAGDTVIITAWTHPILAKSGATGAGELKKRLEGMLPWLGMLPGSKDIYEQGYRDSGEVGVAFLLDVLKLDPATQQYKRRIAASRIVGDLAGIKQAPVLAGLLKDTEPDVRVNAARGLKRLAGNDHGHGDEYWRGDSRAAGEAKWAEWVKQNEAKFR